MRAKSVMMAALVLSSGLAAPRPATAGEPEATTPAAFDAVLAERVGADAYGMRKYVLVVLKSSTTPVPEGEARKAMFAGHFANMARLAEEGTLVLSGPFLEDPAGWRGLFVLAVEDLAAAERIVATDPVVAQGEMVAEYHPWYGSATLALVPEWHEKVAREAP
jgi:uncharacterized protein YciI